MDLTFVAAVRREHINLNGGVEVDGLAGGRGDERDVLLVNGGQEVLVDGRGRWIARVVERPDGELGQDRLVAADMVSMGVARDGCIERRHPPGLEVGDDTGAGIGVAGIDEHDLPGRRLDQDRITLAHVQNRDLEGAGL